MVISKRSLGCCCVAALFVSPAVLANDAADLLQRMAQATEQVSYKGAFVYERSGSFSTHQVWHQADCKPMASRMNGFVATAMYSVPVPILQARSGILLPSQQ